MVQLKTLAILGCHLAGLAFASPVNQEATNNSTNVDASSGMVTLQFFLDTSCSITVGPGGAAETGPSYTVKSTSGESKCYNVAAANAYSYTIDGFFANCRNPDQHFGYAWAVYNSDNCHEYTDEICGGNGKTCYTCDGKACGSAAVLEYAAQN